VTPPSRRGILSRRRQLGVPAPEVDLRRGWFLLRSALSDRGGQLDIKIVRGLLRGLSALHNTASDGPLVEKNQATTKPNARRMECDCEGASEMMVTLACDGC
jgi:hypothetical protein